MPSSDPRERVVRDLARQGHRAFSTDTYSRQGMLDALRELRRREAGSPAVRQLSEEARVFAADLVDVVDLPPADIATVLLAAGGAVGAFAHFRSLSPQAIATLLQYAGDDLDRQANGGAAS